MRQNGTTSAPFFYCVSYEILRETRIKPSFFGNCLIFLSSALGPSAWALKSRLGVLVPSGDRSGPTEPAGETLAAARAHREDSARARPSAWAVNSRLGQLAAARAHREDSARARRGRVGPLSRLAATAPPKGEPSLASPFGGRWCPVGTVQRLTEPAGESGMPKA